MRTNNCIEIVGESIQRREILVMISDSSTLDDIQDCNSLGIALKLWSDMIFLDLPSDMNLNSDGLIRYFSNVVRSGRFQVIEFFRTLKEIESSLKLLPQILCQDRIHNVSAYFKHMLNNRGCNMQLASLFYVNISHRMIEDPVKFGWLVELSTFLSRLQCSSIDYTDENIREYIEFEQHLYDLRCSQEYIDATQPILSSLNVIMREWLDRWTCDRYTPHHGPGSIAGYTRNESTVQCKYAEGNYSSVLSHIDQFFLDSGLQPMLGIYPYIDSNHRIAHCDMKSEIVFVPKTFLKNRVISREDGYMMFFQQGIKDSLVRYINEKCHWIDLRDQSRSRDLARLGSIDGSYATIDLSSASDSVSCYIVQEIFGETPLSSVLRLLRTRSTVLPNSQEIILEKFAPMGSALCFPIECLVFGAVCEYCIRRITGYHSHYNDFVVYGDDIVVREEYASRIIDVLETLGFKVNTLKSYISPVLLTFREACGIECYCGKVITPLRISRRFAVPVKGKPLSVSQIVGLVDFTNRLFAYGLFHMRRRMMAVLDLYGYRHKLLYKDTTINCDIPLALTTFDDSCTNFRLKRRWDKTLFCTCFHAIVVSFEPIPIQNDDIRYHEYWIRLFSKDSSVQVLDRPLDFDEPSFLNVIRPGTRLSWKWVWETR